MKNFKNLKIPKYFTDKIYSNFKWWLHGYLGEGISTGNGTYQVVVKNHQKYNMVHQTYAYSTLDYVVSLESKHLKGQFKVKLDRCLAIYPWAKKSLRVLNYSTLYSTFTENVSATTSTSLQNPTNTQFSHSCCKN